MGHTVTLGGTNQVFKCSKILKLAVEEKNTVFNVKTQKCESVFTIYDSIISGMFYVHLK